MSNIRQQAELRDVNPGDTIQGYYILRKMEMRSTRAGKPYLSLELADRSGRCPGKIWDDAEQISPELTEDQVVKIRGQAQEYQGQLDLNIKQIRMATDLDPVEPEKLIKASTQDLDALYQRILDTIAGLENSHLRTLLTSIFEDQDFREKFSRAPGGKLWHHAMFGGLLEHTVSVMELCQWIANRYENIDAEVLITGALLHDIGKTEELGGRWAIDYTDVGRLVGHLNQGTIIVDRHIRQQNEFPDELRMQVLHLILSHHGELEHGSPIVPKTLEAQILYMADQMDSQINAWQHIIERDKDGQRTWSTFIKPIERFLYLGPTEKNDQPES
jgi:3'-5' exoribonuclease